MTKGGKSEIDVALTLTRAARNAAFHQQKTASSPQRPSPSKEIRHRASVRVLPGLADILRIALAAAGILLGSQSVLMSVFAHQNVWKTSWVLAAVFMGPEVLHWPAVFDMAAITAALAALYSTSLLCTLILFAVPHSLSPKWSIFLAAMLGLLFCCLELYGLTRWFPWLAQERNWLAVLSHLVFAIVTAWLLQRAGEELA